MGESVKGGRFLWASLEHREWLKCCRFSGSRLSRSRTPESVSSSTLCHLTAMPPPDPPTALRATAIRLNCAAVQKPILLSPDPRDASVTHTHTHTHVMFFALAAHEGHEQVQRTCAGHGGVLQRQGRLPPGVRPERRRQLPDAGHQHPPPASQRC